MQLIPLKTRLIEPNDDLLTIFTESLKKKRVKPQNGDIWVIASKVLAVSQGRIVSAKNKKEENQIAKQEADHWLGGKPYHFSVKEGILIPRSGVDASNIGRNKLVLWPKDLWGSTRKIWQQAKKQFKLQKFGIVLTDSTCRPLRHGVSNIALAWAGFEGIADARGQKDLFGKKLKVTRRAVADSLAASAGVLTGEGNEKMPFVLVRDAPVKFTDKEKKPRKFQPKDCLFAPVYSEKLRKMKI